MPYRHRWETVAHRHTRHHTIRDAQALEWVRASDGRFSICNGALLLRAPFPIRGLPPCRGYVLKHLANFKHIPSPRLRYEQSDRVDLCPILSKPIDFRAHLVNPADHGGIDRFAKLSVHRGAHVLRELPRLRRQLCGGKEYLDAEPCRQEEVLDHVHQNVERQYDEAPIHKSSLAIRGAPSRRP